MNVSPVIKRDDVLEDHTFAYCTTEAASRLAPMIAMRSLSVYDCLP